MPLQDFTPELRTRLSRVEKTVGWFVGLAMIVLLTGLGFYIYATAKDRGWFVTKINYSTSLDDFTGFKIGNPVKLMGFDVGEITRFDLQSPDKPHGISIFFSVRDPYYKYIWYDSHIRVISDLLGNRFLEITKGEIGAPSVTNLDGKLLVLRKYIAFQKFKSITNEMLADITHKDESRDTLLNAATNQLIELIKEHPSDYYTNAFTAGFTKPPNPDPHIPYGARNYFYLSALDTPAIQDRLNAVANMVQVALPNILLLTNQLAAVLSNANNAVAHLDAAIAKTDPILTNVAVMTGNLREPNGSLGNWLIPTNLTTQLHDTLQAATATLNSAHTTMDDTDTNITKLATDLDRTLDHLADLTSNLAWQVQVNTNMLTEISTTIVHTDDLIQGLKREWFLRGAFKKKAAQPAHANAVPKSQFPRP